MLSLFCYTMLSNFAILLIMWNHLPVDSLETPFINFGRPFVVTASTHSNMS